MVAHSRPMPARDPSFRPYRMLAWVAYFGVIVLLVTLMVVSIARTLRGTTRPRAAGGPLPTRMALRVCMSDLEGLFHEQNRHAWSFGQELDSEDPLQAWATWSYKWERRVDDLSDRCHLDVAAEDEVGAAERSQLAAARDAMLALHRAYTTYLNRFADEHRDLTRSAVEEIDRARRAITPYP